MYIRSLINLQLLKIMYYDNKCGPMFDIYYGQI